MIENQTQQFAGSIRVISSIKKKERKNGFIKQNKLFFALWLLWMLINLALWASSYAYLNPYYNIGNLWDLQEVIICGAVPLLLFIICKINVRG